MGLTLESPWFCRSPVAANVELGPNRPGTRPGERRPGRPAAGRTDGRVNGNGAHRRQIRKKIRPILTVILASPISRRASLPVRMWRPHFRAATNKAYGLVGLFRGRYCVTLILINGMDNRSSSQAGLPEQTIFNMDGLLAPCAPQYRRQYAVEGLQPG